VERSVLPRRSPALACLPAVVAVLASCAGGANDGTAAGELGGVSVRNVIIWPTADMGTLGMRVVSRDSDALIGVAVGQGGSATMHTVGPDGGGMSEVAEVGLPAGREVVLTVGHPHVMIVGLERELHPGDSLAVIFRFRRAGELSLMVPVARFTEAVKLIGPP
jgi:copper(I)-binding protein